VEITTNDNATVSWSTGLKGKEPTKQADLNFDQTGTTEKDLIVQKSTTARWGDQVHVQNGHFGQSIHQYIHQPW
jgi:hypothetical protein